MAKKRQKQADTAASSAQSAPEVALTGKLAEFRTAIREEIEAARTTAASAAVPLVNGRKIGKAAAGFQYVFEIASVLNLPADTPGDLLIDGRPALEVSVVSIDGMTITLHVADNLGDFVPSAKLQSNLAFLMRGLIRRIESLATRANPVGDRIIDGLPVSGNPSATSVPGLNDQQAEAVRSSLGRDTTFIWGPPGTGKTRTIGAVGEQLYRQGRCVLLVSHTNTAVDQALLHIGRSVSEGDLECGKILRMGEPRDPRLRNWPELLLSHHVERRSQALVQRQHELESEKNSVGEEQARLRHLVNLYEWLPRAEKQAADLSQQRQRLTQIEKEYMELWAEQKRLNADRAKWQDAKSRATDALSWEDSHKQCSRTLNEHEQKRAAAETAVQNARASVVDAERQHQYALSVTWIVRKWRGVDDPEALLRVVQRCRAQVTDSLNALSGANQTILIATNEKERLRGQLEGFRQRFGRSPAEVAAQAEQQAAKMDRVDAALANAVSDRSRLSSRVRECISKMLGQARALKLSQADPMATEEGVAEVQRACMSAKVITTGTDPRTLQTSLDRLAGRLPAIDEELARITAELSTVESSLINDATVIATTLTRSYLRDSLHARRFDTVILDEASMAPLPALWVAASLADRSAVVVGDFKQLPPIVLSENDMAKKWLGRDVFEVAGVNDTGRKIPHRIDLLLQYRMHPEVSKIPNTLFYQHALRDAPETIDGESDLCLSGWYEKVWPDDRPVLLVDMASMGAWVTSVGRGGQPSRFNFLSATVCVDIAEKMLKKDRNPLEAGRAPRILIVCPYRPHARLLELLIRDQGLSGEVVAGTAHSFQGTEANVVIVDLVNDEPHWRVRLFTPEADGDAERLLNVAFTRAQRRLVVVGNFSYIEKCGKKAFLGRILTPLLRQWSDPVSAKATVADGWFARAAKAQARAAVGTVESTHERVVVSQDEFYPRLMDDLTRAKVRVVIFSPFVTANRVGQVGLQLQAAIERGVRVYVITKAISDRGVREKPAYRDLERMLNERGVTLIHKQGMHEKLIFIDHDILWSGSLNPLSFSNTQEVMERRSSAVVVRDYATVIRLDELLSPYESGQQECPYCKSEVVAADSRSGDPFYWKCSGSDCGYTRNAGDDPPTIVDGRLRCRRCGGDLHFEEHRKKPYWRCKANTRHRQRVGAMHLSLPQMAALVPDEWRQKLKPKNAGGQNAKQRQLWPSRNDSHGDNQTPANNAKGSAAGGQGANSDPIDVGPGIPATLGGGGDDAQPKVHAGSAPTGGTAPPASQPAANSPAPPSSPTEPGAPDSLPIWRQTRPEFLKHEKSRLGDEFDLAKANEKYWAAIKKAIADGKADEIPPETMREYNALLKYPWFQ